MPFITRRVEAQFDCPPGKAWVIGADCYLLVARAAHQRGDAAAAALAITPLHLAVHQGWDAVRGRVEEQLAQISSATS